MAMSWGWTPLCQFGNDRYRIGASGEGLQQPSITLSSAQRGIIPTPHLPPETSIVLSNAQQQGSTTSQLLTSLPTNTSVTSNYSGSQTSSSYSSQPPSSEDRVVRRSPRLARATKVSYRDDPESQGRRRNPWNDSDPAPVPVPVPVQARTMWNSDRNQCNSRPNEQPSNKNYSVYNYEGHVINPSVSVSMIYNNNKNVVRNAPQARYHPPTVPFLKPAGFPLTGNSVKSVPRKVTIKCLDFYEVITSLVQEEIIPEGIGQSQCTYSFILKPADVKNLLDKRRKHPYLIQLRFCKLDGTCEQNDYYPATHQVFINHRLILLPGLETMPRGTMRPMDIGSFCQINPQSVNFVTIRCMENCKVYIYVAEKYTSQDLLTRLEDKALIKEEDTVVEIKKKLQADQSDDGIAAATLQASLLCPLSRVRIKLPCRASTCTHLQCFDAATYLQMNECKAKWSCPVCYQPALYKNLQIDGYFKKIIDENTNTDKIELQPDGTWTLVDAKKKSSHESQSVTEKKKEEQSSVVSPEKMVTLDSDDDAPVDNTSSKQDSQANTNASQPVANPRSDSPEIVTISDDDSPVGESPQVARPTYAPPYNNTTSLGSIAATTVDNNDITVESEHINSYFNDFWDSALARSLGSSYTGFHPLDHSNHLYIPLTRTPLTRTPMPPLPSSVSISCTPSERRTTSNSHLPRHTSSGKGSLEKSDTPNTMKSKTNKVRKTDLKKKSKKAKSPDVNVRRKRRRIIIDEWSESGSDSNCESAKKSKSKSIDKRTKKRKQKSKPKTKSKKIVSDSSDDEKSSIFSSSSSSSSSKKSSSSVNSKKSSSSGVNSKKSSSSVNLISSSNSSGSSSNDSDSSSSDSSRDEESSDSSFSMKDPSDTQGASSSRVLRSQLRQKKKKK